MLTDRDERALLAAAEDRVSPPLGIGAALASVRHALARRTRERTQEPGRERESVACQPPRTPLRP
ncbi:hypothetical protein [Streptomyces sp. NPDC047014]|uniref:hypothetical protein n=1 Tax=Streptomyces sp. NPDC047014 TaxID=3155736 RepID=UPI0033D21307